MLTSDMERKATAAQHGLSVISYIISKGLPGPTECATNNSCNLDKLLFVYARKCLVLMIRGGRLVLIALAV